MKPEWMPPLPDVEQEIYRLSRRFVGAPVQGAVRQMMTDYAIAAVEAYKKSQEAQRDRAIAQAVDELGKIPCKNYPQTAAASYWWLVSRADELLRGEDKR